MKNRFFNYKMSACMAAVLIVLTVCSGKAFAAAVTATESATGAANEIYVAGAPNLYPIEYYDVKSKSYKGVIPDLLERVSQKTDKSFVYISAGEKDERKRLARNNQVELVTAILPDNNLEIADIYPVLTIQSGDKKIAYCIGFTGIASDKLVESIKAALAGITDEEKAGILMSYANDEKPTHENYLSLYIAALSTGAVIVMFLTIVAIKMHRKKKDRQSNFIDPLTGIGNDKYYIYLFSSLISDQAKYLYNVAYIGLDFEKYESLWGKQACDDIQKYAAAYLHSKVSSAEYLVRLSNGVFAFVFQAENEEKISYRIQRTVSGLNKYLSEFNRDWAHLFAAGVCCLEKHRDCNAETALYNAKQGYIYAKQQNLICHISLGEQVSEIKKNAKLRSQINDAIEKGEFKIYMQFITESNTANICGAEVLSRWQNPEYGLLKPYEYIDLLKETEKIVLHDYRVFENVCKQLEHWNKPPYNKLFLSCNFTRISVSKADFCDEIYKISKQYQIDLNRIVIEVTEDSLAVNSKTVTENIRKCSEMGFKIAIDDMGAGFSSFADLYDNEIDIVKIEKDFISTCASERRHKMLGDIITLVHNAGAKVICEGIENERQQEIIKEIGCDMAQGFYYSRVLPLSECERFISTKNIVEDSAL